MTREERKINKEHCKGMPFDVKIQCWFTRNKEVITPIICSVLTSSITIIVLLIIG